MLYTQTNEIRRTKPPKPLVRSYDHVELLGDILEAIAWQKAGIIKAGRPALTAETQVGVWDGLLLMAAGWMWGGIARACLKQQPTPRAVNAATTPDT